MTDEHRHMLKLPDGWHMQIYQTPNDDGWFFRFAWIREIAGTNMFMHTTDPISEDKKKVVMEVFKKVKDELVHVDELADLKQRLVQWHQFKGPGSDHHLRVLEWFTDRAGESHDT